MDRDPIAVRFLGKNHDTIRAGKGILVLRTAIGQMISHLFTAKGIRHAEASSRVIFRTIDKAGACTGSLIHSIQ